MTVTGLLIVPVSIQLLAIALIVMKESATTQNLLEEMKRMMETSTAALQAQAKMAIASFDHLATSVQGIEDVVPSVVALLTGISAEVRALRDEPGAADALAQRIDHAKDALAAAVVAVQADDPVVDPVALKAAVVADEAAKADAAKPVVTEAPPSDVAPA